MARFFTWGEWYLADSPLDSKLWAGALSYDYITLNTALNIQTLLTPLIVHESSNAMRTKGLIRTFL